MISINQIFDTCDKTMSFEKVIETKRSRRPNEDKDSYKNVPPVKQLVTFNFLNVSLKSIIENAIGNLVVTVQNGTLRRSMDSIDKASGHSGDQWRSVHTDNMTINVSEKRSGNVEVPIHQRLASMTKEELASNMTEEQLRAALDVLVKRCAK